VAADAGHIQSASDALHAEVEACFAGFAFCQWIRHGEKVVVETGAVNLLSDFIEFQTEDLPLWFHEALPLLYCRIKDLSIETLLGGDFAISSQYEIIYSERKACS
jgi:hypothetical protein